MNTLLHSMACDKATSCLPVAWLWQRGYYAPCNSVLLLTAWLTDWPVYLPSQWRGGLHPDSASQPAAAERKREYYQKDRAGNQNKRVREKKELKDIERNWESDRNRGGGSFKFRNYSTHWAQLKWGEFRQIGTGERERGEKKRQRWSKHAWRAAN